MREYLLLTGAALIGLGGSAYAAIDCAVPPTCEELGYVLTEDDCDGRATLTCPFDTSKVFCGVSCEELGYVYTGTLTECLYDGTKVFCPFGSDYFKCEGGVDTAAQCKTLGYTKGGPSETGNLVVQSCLAGQEKVPCPYNSSYFRCDGESSVPEIGGSTPTMKNCAEINGEYFSNINNCICEYGYVSADTTGSDGTCYRCGTESECTTSSGAFICPRCTTLAPTL